MNFLTGKNLTFYSPTPKNLSTTLAPKNTTAPSNALAALAPMDIYGGADGNEGTESDTTEATTMSMQEQEQAIGQLGVISKFAPVPVNIAMNIAQKGLQALHDKNANTPGVAGGANPGPGTGGPAANSPAGGAQAAAGHAPGTGVPGTPGQPGSIGSPNPTNAPQSAVDNNNGAGDAGGGDGTVICTELRRQGLMSDEIWEADMRFGQQTDPRIKAGYLLWAKPVVRGMRRSKLFTHFVNALARPWSAHMAHEMGVGEDNRFGAALMTVGLPVCRILGSERITNRFRNASAFKLKNVTLRQ